MGDIRREIEDKRGRWREMGDKRWETGDGRWFSVVITEKFCAFYLVGEIYKFLKKALNDN